ncbi:MAG: DNA primase [Anaerolineales bacterium]|nr:DNA primase [Anaerolineales bacterium]
MSVVDEIKARLDIVDVVSRYVSLKKAGRTYKALCPFHAEKTPSFVVYPESQHWRCFGSCAEGGDIFTFVMKIEHLDFRDTLQKLAGQAGVEIHQQSDEDRARQEADDRLLTLLDTAASLYMEYLLHEPDAAPVRDYVFGKRGLTEDTVRQFQLGYAPDEWDVALNHFRRSGYSIDELIAAGMASTNDQGRVYDRFRHRLMIPIRDGRGRTLGFGARALSDNQQPKYLNSPQGPLFDKSKLLYGFDLARRSIREQETVIVVEGYMDVIQAHQAGYGNVVAQMGTALTESQVRQLAKHANGLILALDTDEAGLNATMRGLDVVRESLTQQNAVFDTRSMMRSAGKLSLDVRVLRLPRGKDPDDFLRATPEQWPAVVAGAIPLVDYVIDVGTKHLTPQATIQEREQVARQLLPLLTATENDLHRHQNIQRLALRLRIAERDLVALVNARNATTAQRVPRATPHQNHRAAPSRNLPNGHALERHCIASLLHQPAWLFSLNRKLREMAGSDPIAMPLLGPLHSADFSREDYRTVFKLIETANYQEDPYIFLSYEVPLEIAEDIVLGLEVFEKQASPLHTTELASILREVNHAVADREQLAFLVAGLQLRLERLKRERNERYFFTSTNEQEVLETEEQENIRMYTRAQRLLEQAVRELTGRRQKSG